MQREPVSIPVPLVKREKPLIRVVGVDPGFATMGITILEQEQGSRPRALLAKVVETEKLAGKRKALMETRVSTDDQRRLSELWYGLEESVQDPEKRPFLVGLEAYRPFKGKGGGNAWKSAIGYGLASAWARHRGWPLMVFLPDDLKRAFGLGGQRIPGTKKRVKVSKEEVEAAMCKKVDGLRELLDQLHKDDREHAADAAGHAYLALVEQTKMLAHFQQVQGG